MANLTIYRGENPANLVATVSIDDKTVYNHKVMEIETISSEFYVPAAIPIQLGDYIVFNNKNYYLNVLPSIKKTGHLTNKYNATFNGVLYDLNNKLFISSDGLSEFSETGNVALFLQLIVDSINTISAGWQVGEVEQSNDLRLDFVNETCLEALRKVALEFKFEYELNGKVINFKKAIGSPRELTFEYGRNLGLYNIERKQVDSKAVYTRVYGFGGTKNIPFDYRNRAKRLVFEERILEKNVNVFGVREAQFTDESIYPKRTAVLTDVNVQFSVDAYDNNSSWVEDTTLNFDINEYLLEGQSAKIVFKTGDLAGVEFEIWKADFNSKRIYFNAFNDTDDYSLPNLTKQPKIGDEYTLVDLKMPEAYVIAAERELKAATQVFLDDNSIPKTLYIVQLDPKFTKENNIVLVAGDLVKIIDKTIGINAAIRIQELSFPLVNPNKITAFIADYIPYTLQDYANRTAVKTIKSFKAVNTKIENLVAGQKTVVTAKTETTEVKQAFQVTINGRKYWLVKAYDNDTQNEFLEIDDIIYGNWWDRYFYVTGWRYKGGEPTLIENWNRAKTINFTPF